MQEKPENLSPQPPKKVTAKIVKKKKKWFEKFGESFFGEDADNVLAYLIQDVLLPAAKTTISDIVTSGIEMLLFGEAGGRRKSVGRGPVPYGSMYKERDSYRRTNRLEPKARSRFTFDEIVLEDRGEAEDVLSNLLELIENYEVATVADFYELVGIEGEFSDNKYGWFNLSRAFLKRVPSGGFTLVLPKPQLLD